MYTGGQNKWHLYEHVFAYVKISYKGSRILEVKMRNEIIVVTGAGGFIAQKLIYALKAKNPQCIIRGIDIIPGSYSGCDESVACDLSEDIKDDSILLKALAKADVVYHLAGKVHSLSEVHGDDEEYWRINVTGSRNLLEAARKNNIKRFVFFSSVKVFGERQMNSGLKPLSETDEAIPDTPYGKTKLEFERILCQECGIITPVILRLSMVYGPNSKGNLKKMISAVKKGIPIPLPEFHNKRSMVDVRDVIRIAVLVGQINSSAKGLYQVTDGNLYTTRQMLDFIREACGKRPSHIAIPKLLFIIPARIGDIIGRIMKKRFYFDSDSLNKLAGNAWFSSDRIEKELHFNPEWNLHKSLLSEYNKGENK